MNSSVIVACAMAMALVPYALSANGLEPEPEHSMPSEATLAQGRDAYDARCAVCHARPAAIMDGIPGDSRDERAAWLDVFLTDHYAAEEEVREAIIYWLLDR